MKFNASGTVKSVASQNRRLRTQQHQGREPAEGRQRTGSPRAAGRIGKRLAGVAFQEEQRHLLGRVQAAERPVPSRSACRGPAASIWARAETKNNRATSPAVATFTPNQASHCRRVPLRNSSINMARLMAGTTNIAG